MDFKSGRIVVVATSFSAINTAIKWGRNMISLNEWSIDFYNSVSEPHLSTGQNYRVGGNVTKFSQKSFF